MASLLREHMARGGDDARALLRQIFQTEADLTPDLAANTLTVRLHHLTQAAHDQTIEQMLAVSRHCEACEAFIYAQLLRF
jgi:hypothetical protein